MAIKAAPPWRKRLYIPAYSISEAAHLSEISAQTVSSWHSGSHTRVVFQKPKSSGTPLSYLQLVEVAFVASFRRYGVALAKIQAAHDYLSKTFKTEHPFATLQLKTDGLHVLKDFQEAERLARAFIVADTAGQLMWPELVLKRIYQFGYEKEIAIRWHPRGQDVPVVIDPRVSFGAPIIEGTGVATWVVRERLTAGESLAEIMDDFGLTETEVRQASAFEGVPIQEAA